jgi:hypothetical protein
MEQLGNLFTISSHSVFKSLHLAMHADDTGSRLSASCRPRTIVASASPTGSCEPRTAKRRTATPNRPALIQFSLSSRPRPRRPGSVAGPRILHWTLAVTQPQWAAGPGWRSCTASVPTFRHRSFRDRRGHERVQKHFNEWGRTVCTARAYLLPQEITPQDSARHSPAGYCRWPTAAATGWARRR